MSRYTNCDSAEALPVSSTLARRSASNKFPHSGCTRRRLVRFLHSAFVLRLMGFKSEAASWQCVKTNQFTRPVLDRLTEASPSKDDGDLFLSTESKQLWVRRPDQPKLTRPARDEKIQTMCTHMPQQRTGPDQQKWPITRLSRRTRPAHSPGPAPSCQQRVSFLPLFHPNASVSGKIEQCLTHNSCQTTLG